MTRGSIRRAAWLALISAAVIAVETSSVHAKVRTLRTPGGELRVQVDSKPSKLLFPLADTKVNARITGYVAQVAVKQRFKNPFKKALEAVYVFPLPQNAVISSLRIRIGGRTITAVIKSRADARKIYDKAKRAGKTAVRLDQERANIFTHSVVNIAPGKAVLVELVYDVELRQHNRQYEFVYPMVVGPRYIPGRPTGKPTKGGGRKPDTIRVPDASRITPPILKPGSRSGHNIDVQVTIDPGAAINTPISPTHKIIVKRANDAKRPHAVIVRLAKGDQIPNRDFVVRYRLTGANPTVAVIAHRGKRGGFLTLMAYPPARIKVADMTPKDLIFVVDTTGSMAGEPLAMIKQSLRYALRNLNPKDRFQIMRFADSASSFTQKPIANTPANVRRALSYVNGLTAGGSSELLSGVRASLAGRASADRVRIVCFMTDGLVGNDAEILAQVSKLIGPRTRLFPMGVGSSVNRSLLERMASLGRGVVHYMLLRKRSTKQVKAFYDRLRAPVMTNITIDWKGLDVKDLTPSPIPDVFAGRPLRLTGRYDRPGEATIVVRAKYAGKDVSFRIPVSLPIARDDHGVLGRLWARARIRQHMAFTHGKRTAAHIKTITGLGLKYGLVTKYTSLVAADKRAVNPGGKVRTYYVPVEMPQGVSYRATLLDGAGGTVFTKTTQRGSVDVDRSGGAPAKLGSPSADVRLTAAVSFRERQRPGRWYFGAGLSTGIVGVERDNVGNAIQSQLNLQAAHTIVRGLRVGLELTVFLPKFKTDNGGTHLLFRATYFSVLEGRLGLGGGLGLAFPFNDRIGVAFLVAGSYRLPALGSLLPSLQLRYEGHHVPVNGNDLRAFTFGAGFGF